MLYIQKGMINNAGFNPYFNGYSTLTDIEEISILQFIGLVSILILMDTLL